MMLESAQVEVLLQLKVLQCNYCTACLGQHFFPDFFTYSASPHALAVFMSVSVSVYAERPRNAVSVNGAYLL